MKERWRWHPTLWKLEKNIINTFYTRFCKYTNDSFVLFTTIRSLFDIIAQKNAMKNIRIAPHKMSEKFPLNFFENCIIFSNFSMNLSLDRQEIDKTMNFHLLYNVIHVLMFVRMDFPERHLQLPSDSKPNYLMCVMKSFLNFVLLPFVHFTDTFPCIFRSFWCTQQLIQY